MAKKILLADDSITIQKVVRITLADGDYNLIAVDNGNEALERVRAERPDLVLLDVVMPGKDGYQVCEEIKKDPELAHIPVILLAGSFEGFDEIKGAGIGADGYIIKPFESQALISKVEEMLRRPRAQARGYVPKEEPAQREATVPISQEATVGPEPALGMDREVKDFMESLSGEMDQAGEEEVAKVEPVQEEIAEAEAVSEEELWEAEPLADETVSSGEAVLEGEAVSEEELWAEPVEEGAGEAEGVMGAEEVSEPEMIAEAEPAPGAEAMPAEGGEYLGEYEQEPGITEPGSPLEAEAQSVLGEEISGQVQAKVAEAVEEIATAVQAGLGREELIELIRATVERVAWEVVPELAEALIKERISRWEAQTQ